MGADQGRVADTGHWPNQLYVREARRMVGDFVVTQKDLQTERTKPDAIGMGSYNSDSHNVQRYVAEGGIVLNEGNVEVPVQPYQIPYRVVLPKKTEAETCSYRCLSQRVMSPFQSSDGAAVDDNRARNGSGGGARDQAESRCTGCAYR